MTAWNHQKSLDHLRRRAESYIQQGRSKSEPSAASMGHIRSQQSSAHSTEIRNDLYDSPYLSEMSGAFNGRK